MRQSKLFSKTTKNISQDEVSLNAQLLQRAGFVDKLMAGVYTYLPLGFRVYKKIEQIIREEMEQIGGQEIYMPSLHPQENWLKTGRWEGMDDLFKIREEGKNFALGATHEEIVTPLAKKFIASYKDLPLAVFQIQNKFRQEKRAKSGLLRGREFIMKDLYSFHINQEDLDNYYEKVKKAYENIFNRCGIGHLTYLTYAGGGTFSRYSHEFQTLTSAGEDLIYICDSCRVAVNKEIIEEVKNKCPVCGRGGLREEKAVEVGNIFKLGIKFSQAFDLTYLDKKGERQLVIMGCYGIGLGRVLGTIVEVNHDQKGIIWPVEVAPFRVHLISLAGEDKVVREKAEKLYQELVERGVEVLYDDRLEASAGEKFADADLIGCPYRLVISRKTSTGVEIKKRSESEGKVVKQGEVIKILS